jgi:hypothetical protein
MLQGSSRLRANRSSNRLDIVSQHDRRRIPLAVLEGLRSWRYAKAQPAAPARRAYSRIAVRPVLTTGACIVAMLFFVVPLLTLEADARRGGGSRNLAKFCDEKVPGVTDLPIDRITQAVQPTPAQRAALDELKDASVKAAGRLKVSCPTYQTLTPTGRVEAMEKGLEATLDAVKIVQPALARFYNSLSDEQKSRFNSIRSASQRWQRRPIAGTLRPAPNAPDDSKVSPERTAAMFWPDAADDLVQYVLFPKGNDRFWQHGYDSIVDAAFASSAVDDRRRPRTNQVIDAATPAKVPLSSANLCGGTSAADDANALIERIEHAIGPNASQRDVLEQLRTALSQAVERILQIR